MLKRTVNFLRGHVRLEVEGPFPERFLNLCAQNGVPFWGVEWLEQTRLRLSITRRKRGEAVQLAERVGCAVTPAGEAGMPYFLARFRKRYALLVGLALSLAAVCVLSRFVLTIDVEGNVNVPTAQILSELRRQGLRPGVYGPSLDQGILVQEALLQLPELSWMAVNLHGTRAEVLVREAIPKPEEEYPNQVGDIVAESGGILLRVEALAGEAQYQTGDTVAEGDVLISGRVRLEGPPYSEADLGWQQVRAEGSVYARTWRTMTAEFPLEAQAKTYTGAEETLWSVSILGQRTVFSRNSGISFPKYDKISETWTARLPGGREMPLALTRETAREYTLTPCPVDQFAAQDLLEARLLAMLEAELGESGEVLDAKYTARLRDGMLEVTLLAECREEIGRFVPGPLPAPEGEDQVGTS